MNQNENHSYERVHDVRSLYGTPLISPTRAAIALLFAIILVVITITFGPVADRNKEANINSFADPDNNLRWYSWTTEFGTYIRALGVVAPHTSTTTGPADTVVRHRKFPYWADSTHGTIAVATGFPLRCSVHYRWFDNAHNVRTREWIPIRTGLQSPESLVPISDFGVPMRFLWCELTANIVIFCVFIYTILLIVALYQRRLRRMRCRCVECGYVLMVGSIRCPECGSRSGPDTPA